MKKFGHLKNGKGRCLLAALVLMATVAPWSQSSVQAQAPYTWNGSISGTNATRNTGETGPGAPTRNGSTNTFNNTDVNLSYFTSSGTSTVIVNNGDLTVVGGPGIRDPLNVYNADVKFTINGGKFLFNAATSASAGTYFAKKMALANGSGLGHSFSISANEIALKDVVNRGAKSSFIATKNDGYDGSIHMEMFANRNWLLTDTTGNLVDPNGAVVRRNGELSDPVMMVDGHKTTTSLIQGEGNVFIDSLQTKEISKGSAYSVGYGGRWDDQDGYYSLVPVRTEVIGKNVSIDGINLNDAVAKSTYPDGSDNFGIQALNIGNASITATGGNIDIVGAVGREAKNKGVGYFVVKNGGLYMEAKKDAHEQDPGSTGNVYLLDGLVSDRPVKWELNDASALGLSDYAKADLYVIADNKIEQKTSTAYGKDSSLIVNQGTTVMKAKEVDLKGAIQNAGTFAVKADKNTEDGGSIHVNTYETVKHTEYKKTKEWGSQGNESANTFYELTYGVSQEEETLRKRTSGVVYYFKNTKEDKEVATKGELIGDTAVTLDNAKLGTEGNIDSPINHTLHVESKEAAATVGNLFMYSGSKADVFGEGGSGITNVAWVDGKDAKLKVHLQENAQPEGHIQLGKYQDGNNDFEEDGGLVYAGNYAEIDANAGNQDGNSIIGGQVFSENGGLIKGTAEKGTITLNSIGSNGGRTILKAKGKISADHGGLFDGDRNFTWYKVNDPDYDWSTAGLVQLESTDAKLAEIKGNLSTYSGGIIRSVDTNLHLGDLIGYGTTIDIRRKDFVNEGNTDYRPNGDEAPGRYVVVDSLSDTSNNFLMTVSSTALNSDFLYIKNGSSRAQTVTLKNMEGIVNEMKGMHAESDGTVRVPFAMVFHNDSASGTFSVKGKPESWDGRLVRSVVSIDRKKATEEPNETWKSGYHKADNGKLSWETFRDESSETPANVLLRRALVTSAVETPDYHLGNTDNANIYYLVLATEQNKPLTDAVRAISDNLWNLATDMDPDVDQLHGAFMGARYFDEGKPLYEGVWARYSQDKYRPAYDSMISHTYEIGYDHAWRGKSGNRRVGMSFEHIQASGDGASETFFDGTASHHGSYRLSAIRYYDMWFGDKGHYRNLMAKAGQGLGSYSLSSRSGKYSGEIHGAFYSVGGEYGYRKDLGKNVYFIPQLQVQYTHFGDDDFTTSDGIQFHNEGGNSFRTRLGFKLGREVTYDKNNKDQWFLRVNWHKEWMGDGGMSALDTYNTFQTFSWERKASWYEVGFGVNAHMTKNVSGYLDFSRHYGHDAQKRYDLNIGIQIRS